MKIFMPGSDVPIERDLPLDKMIALAPGDSVSVDGDEFMVQAIKMKISSDKPGEERGEIRVVKRTERPSN